MPDDTNNQQAPAVQPTPVVIVDSVTATQQAIAQAARDAEAAQLDETVEGGAYLVGGRWVNAIGEPIKTPKGK